MTNERKELARRQAEALRMILSGRGAEGAPVDVFHAQLGRTATTLMAKRRREAALCLPLLAGYLGERFAGQFEAYAGGQGYPAKGGPRADAAGFARWVMGRDARVPEACVLEAAWLPGGRGLVVWFCRGVEGFVVVRYGRRLWLWRRGKKRGKEA